MKSILAKKEIVFNQIAGLSTLNAKRIPKELVRENDYSSRWFQGELLCKSENSSIKLD
jgi:hypothetical protein